MIKPFDIGLALFIFVAMMVLCEFFLLMGYHDGFGDGFEYCRLLIKDELDELNVTLSALNQMMEGNYELVLPF